MVWRQFNLIGGLNTVELFSVMWPYLWTEYLFKCELHCHLIVLDSSDYHPAWEACRFARTSPVVAQLPFEASRWWYSSSEMFPESRGRPGCPVFVSFLVWSYFFKLSPSYTDCIYPAVCFCYTWHVIFALSILRVIERRVIEQEGHTTNSSSFWRPQNCWSVTRNKHPELLNASRREMIMSPECHNLSAGGVAVLFQCHIVLMPNQLTTGKHISLPFNCRRTTSLS